MHKYQLLEIPIEIDVCFKIFGFMFSLVTDNRVKFGVEEPMPLSFDAFHLKRKETMFKYGSIGKVT